MAEFNSYAAPSTPLTGTEQVLLAQGGATKTGTVANVLGAPAPMIPTKVTASGPVLGEWATADIANATGTTLSAATLVNAFITRTNTVAAFTDTTDTAANIVAAITSPNTSLTFLFRYMNTTSYAATIAAGTGVTLSGTATVAGGAWRDFIGYITNVGSPAVTIANAGGGTV